MTTLFHHQDFVCQKRRKLWHCGTLCLAYLSRPRGFLRLEMKKTRMMMMKWIARAVSTVATNRPNWTKSDSMFLRPTTELATMKHTATGVTLGRGQVTSSEVPTHVCVGHAYWLLRVCACVCQIMVLILTRRTGRLFTSADRRLRWTCLSNVGLW